MVKTINPKWLQIRDDSGEVGLVPANYVSFYEQELKCEALFSFKAQTARQVSFEKVRRYAQCSDIPLEHSTLEPSISGRHVFKTTSGSHVKYTIMAEGIRS